MEAFLWHDNKAGNFFVCARCDGVEAVRIMATPSVDARSERWIKESRGRGAGKDYRPWLTVRATPSAGRSHRVWEFQTERTHHLLPDLELAAFFLFDWNPNVTDIRKQYPLSSSCPGEKTFSLGLSKRCERITVPRRGAGPCESPRVLPGPRSGPVAPAQRSAEAKAEVARRYHEDGTPIHSFPTLLAEFATIVRNTGRAAGNARMLSGVWTMPRPLPLRPS